MKGVVFAAAMLLGSASAGVHKLKLNKIPLSEQLVSIAFMPLEMPWGTQDDLRLPFDSDG
jgi:hypothetical protein